MKINYLDILFKVREELENKYGVDFLYGKCIEASDKIVALLSQQGVRSKIVEGWVIYDNPEGCTDRDYDEHTWVETEDNYILDVTATQFNHFMDEDYPSIIVSEELPYGFSYDEPDIGWNSYAERLEFEDKIHSNPEYEKLFEGVDLESKKQVHNRFIELAQQLIDIIPAGPLNENGESIITEEDLKGWEF